MLQRRSASKSVITLRRNLGRAAAIALGPAAFSGAEVLAGMLELKALRDLTLNAARGSECGI
jgi:hypothetical protein